MFKQYRELCDVVSLVAYCPGDRSYLLTRDINEEYWIPSCKIGKLCWKATASKLNQEIFGKEAPAHCVPLRVYKVWLPEHRLTSVYHAVYKVSIKSDTKRRTKLKPIGKQPLKWFNNQELERQRAHAMLKSPEVAVFAMMAVGDQPKDPEGIDYDTGLLIEICEDNLILAAEAAAGAVGAPNFQLLQAASYSKADQIRMYREFLVMTFPALYMSPQVFGNFMVDLGWQRNQCPSLFRAADVSGRGGISFLELLLWAAALEPSTLHNGISAEIRCRYIFRYFDSNRDQILEYEEVKELMAAVRAGRQLAIDAVSVARDADMCIKQLGLPQNSQMSLSDFLRSVGELRLRGTSSLLRAPRSISAYLLDLHDHREAGAGKRTLSQETMTVFPQSSQQPGLPALATAGVRRSGVRQDYTIALYTMRLRKAANELTELRNFDEDAVSASTAVLVGGVAAAASLDVLGPSTGPVEAIAAVHYFAARLDKSTAITSQFSSRRHTSGKASYTWSHPMEQATLGTLLLKLSDLVRPLVSVEPRLLRITSPVYVVGDLHGNLAALLAMETSLWATGAAMSPARILFLGDFVDRGPHGCELMAYLLAAKVQRPHGIFLVRGNHEIRDIQKMFTFHNECLSKYGEVEGNKVWQAINTVFDSLPLAAVVDDKVFCCHGGIPPPWVCPLISAIDKVPVPLSRPAEQSTIAWELLWNDPIKPNKITATLALELTANEGFATNVKRGTGHVFDQAALDRFLLANQLSHVIRAHELHQNGFMCQQRGRLISVFSSSNYCGGNNDTGVALLEGTKIRLIRLTDDLRSHPPPAQHSEL